MFKNKGEKNLMNLHDTADSMLKGQILGLCVITIRRKLNFLLKLLILKHFVNV